jgi:hypothetical protein
LRVFLSSFVFAVLAAWTSSSLAASDACRLALRWTAQVDQIENPQQDYLAWEKLGRAYMKEALDRPEDFPKLIPFAVRALQNAEELASYLAEESVFKRIQKELIYVEEMDGNFRFLNEVFVSARVKVLNFEQGVPDLAQDAMFVEDQVTSVFASNLSAIQRVILETDNMISSLQVAYRLVQRFSEDFLSAYFRAHLAEEGPKVSETIYAAAVPMYVELLRRIRFLLKEGEVEKAAEFFGRLTETALLLPTDSRTSTGLQLATGELFTPEINSIRYEVGRKVAELLGATGPVLFKEIGSVEAFALVRKFNQDLSKPHWGSLWLLSQYLKSLILLLKKQNSK